MTTTRADPLSSFKYHVEIGSITEAVFTECSGVQAEIVVDEYLEGGVNDRVHKLPSRAKFGNVTLKRGVCLSDALWEWWKGILQGPVSRKDVTIVMHDQQGEPVANWILADAFPVKWVAPPLRGGESSAAIETLELAYEGVRFL